MKTFKNSIAPKHKEIDKLALIGWYKETTIYDISGCDWNIETYKWDNAIRCCAKIGYAASEGFIPANRPLHRLHWERRHCSKNTVIEIHEKGLERFDKMIVSGLVLIPTHIVDWVKNEKYRADIKMYGNIENYTQSNTHS
ncbi:hypothetical protein [Aquimarina macrocephali]|uniref:hypothetical protein n=1 Tax=Aquimarina macrocephali TaxID=666563 RepID=UPI0004664B0A|nr:hypothetical protein [Aquimarina macrocephali]